jgi:serine/threonine protein kinase
VCQVISPSDLQVDSDEEPLTGGSKRISLATHLKTQEKVALVQLLPNILKQLEMGPRLKQFATPFSDLVNLLAEVQVLNAARHNHIVQLKGIIIPSEALQYSAAKTTSSSAPLSLKNVFNIRFVLEWCPQSLFVLQQSNDLNDKQRWRYIEQLAYALVYLHGLSPPIIHRDLKSKNILIDQRGDLKLADFGLARQQIKSSGVTTKGGTLNYLAPEQVDVSETKSKVRPCFLSRPFGAAF